jgi:acyl-CoA thioesterase FadM
MKVVRVGDKSFTYEVEFLVNGKRVALGKTTSVCCEVGKEMKSITIPKGIRGKLTGEG